MKRIKILVIFCLLTFTISCGQQKKYIQYTVKKGETIRTIARDLEMKTKDLLRLNPDVGRRPSPNTVIIIPNTQTKTVNTTEEIEKSKDSIIDVKEVVEVNLEELKKEFVLHEVKKGDTFFNLTRFYNVTQEELIVLNPELSEGIKVDTTIKIKKIVEGEEEVTFYEDIIEEDASLKVALLLPFRASYFDTISSREIYRRNRLANIVTDFYLGADIAIDSLKEQGIEIELNVFDTGKKNSKIREIIAENDLNENDVIIGPLYSDEAKIVANKVSIPVVFPVYSKSQSQFSSSRMIKTMPDGESYREAMLTYLKESYANQNIVVVSDSINKASGNLWKTTSTLKKHDSISIVTVVTPKKGYIKKELLINALKSGEDNWVIIDTKDNVIASDAINSLISLPNEEDVERMKEKDKRKKITIQALADSTSVRIISFEKGKTFEKVDNLKLSKLNFTFASDQFIDENSPSVKVFNNKYYERNKTLPSYYATKGFDITYDILIRLASGKKLKNTFKDGASFRLESKFDFSKKLFNTSENNGLFIVQYNSDLTLTRLK